MFIVQDINGKTTSVCRKIPEPTVETWIEVPDNDPRCVIAVLQAQPTLAQQAQSALDKVTGPSGTIMRCMAAGVAVPAAWSAYVLALRLLATGKDTASTIVPQPPKNADGSVAYPAGT